MSGNRVVTQERLDALVEMEERYERGDTGYFAGLLGHDDYVVRTRATCILADFGGEDKIPHIARVLQERSKRAGQARGGLLLGQMGYAGGVKHLEDATLNDSSMFVRHEAAIALGVIGNRDAKQALERALDDPDPPVVESAVVALSNIEFMEKLSKNEKFARLTGG